MLQAVSRVVQTLVNTVEQVRLQSAATENVVNYTVVVEVPNTDGKLLPGMTANVDFLAKSAENVLTVPNAALRFTPPSDMLQNARSRETVGAPVSPPARAGGERRQRPKDAGRVWTTDAAGKLSMIRVKTGISNGSITEVASEELKQGMQVITGVASTEAASNASPFSGAQQQQGGRRGPGGF